MHGSMHQAARMNIATPLYRNHLVECIDDIQQFITYGHKSSPSSNTAGSRAGLDSALPADAIPQKPPGTAAGRGFVTKDAYTRACICSRALQCGAPIDNFTRIPRGLEIETELFISFMIFGIIAAVTPGPNNVMLTTTGLNFGVRRGIPHLLGICIGFPVMLALIGLGFGTLFQLLPMLHEIIKIVGILYLIFLAWKIASTSAGADGETPSKPIGFWQSAAFQWINPKAWVMGSSALAAYTSLDDNFFLQVAIICISFGVITLPCAGLWLVFGAGLQRFLRDPVHRRTFNVVMALLLIASIVPVIVEVIG
jgi:threonine/homoserine/homoserine lactone efflux protein